MKGNFDACLAEVLKHEGGFVNHPRLDAKDKVSYIDAWSTHKSSLTTLFLPFSKRVHPFIKSQFAKTRGPIPAALTDASMMPLLEDFATPTICVNARARTYPPLFGTGAKKINAGNVMSRLMARADGRFAKAIIAKKDEPLCAPFALRRLVVDALNAIKSIHIMFMTFIIQGTCKRILQSVRQSKAQALKPLHLKLRNAFSYAPIVTG